jgi:hypothetical protein
MADSSSSFKWLFYSSTLAHQDAVGKGRSPYHYLIALLRSQVQFDIGDKECHTFYTETMTTKSNV